MFDRHLKVWPKGVPHHFDLPEQTLTRNLTDTAARNPSKPAIIYHGHTLTYAELNAQVEALAGYLQKRAGVKRGDRVLLYMQNSPQFIIGYYAILRADAAVIPVNPMSRHAELIHYADNAGASVMLTGQELLPFATPVASEGHLKTIIAANYGELSDPACDIPLPEPLNTLNPADISGPGVVRWTDAVAENITPDAPQATPDDLAVIPYSSGTTGAPKGCVHTHRTVQVTCIGGLIWNPMGEHDVSLTVLPLFHVTGMQAAMNSPIYSGGTMVVMTRWNRATAAALIQRHRVTRWRSISTMAIDLVNDPDFDSYDLSSLTAIGGGGAAMPAAIATKLKDMTGLDYIEGYGMSETMAATHINPTDAPKRQCLGIPVFDVDCRVVDPATDHELGPNETGEILMSGPQVFKGYWRNDQATAEALIQRDGKTFLRTGDLGYYDEDGYFFMVDRVKRMINASGFKIWPAEVEALMHKHPNIAEVCIISTKDPRRGESVKAVIVRKPKAGDNLTAEDVITWCKTEMAAYKCPRTVEFTDSLPKSGSGKVLWRELQQIEDARSGKAS
ncbi:long-chain fatty acid--CoA ligase [Thalassobius vesicularis]|uniref:Long-chain fatty acid--CoA ligase n=1 Tax=Thalassobius vesicularis TaxID=1294297 RepID=A0A4V6RRW8_9RHOB|nr:long-chain-fatty-acid--CoA ligase [Thalassobius vesicularis]THD74137.1 long-chain fatty acid--CoA ligase [Thalassobius vesicularis]